MVWSPYYSKGGAYPTLPYYYSQPAILSIPAPLEFSGMVWIGP